MRFLLDENLPAKLRFDFGPAHIVRTARELSWHGLKDQPLLEAMTAAYFDALVTLDKNLRYQQNIAR